MKTILITGATAGFGEAIARKFAENNYRLIVCGRRKDRLKKLEATLREKFSTKILSLSFDVRKNAEVKNAIETLPEEWKTIDMLVNNAGGAQGLSHIQDGDTEDWDTMIDANVKGLLYVTRCVAPLMIAKNSGYIFNVGSTAGKYVYENGNVYCATKFAVDALTEAMRIDMLKHNIRVTGIHPGAAETEFSLVRFKGDTERAKKVYEGFKPLEAVDIAEIIFFCASLPAHVNINELVVTPTAQANPFYINRKN